LPIGTAVVAVLLIVRGLALGVPYLSPSTPTAAPTQMNTTHSCH
jgi:hypothetical protein